MQNLSPGLWKIWHQTRNNTCLCRWHMGAQYILLTRGEWRPAKIRKTCARKVQSFWKKSLVLFLITVVSVNLNSRLWVWHIYCTWSWRVLTYLSKGGILVSLLLYTFPNLSVCSYSPSQSRTSNTMLLSLPKLTYDAKSKDICFLVRKWKMTVKLHLPFAPSVVFNLSSNAIVDTNLTSFFDCITPVIDSWPSSSGRTTIC